MTPEKLKDILRDIGVSQVQFGELLGHNGRTGQYWCGVSVPGAVATIALLLHENPAMLAVIERIAERRDAAERKVAKKAGK